MKKVLIVLIVSVITLNFSDKISEQTSLLLLGIVLIGVASFGRKKLFKK